MIKKIEEAKINKFNKEKEEKTQKENILKNTEKEKEQEKVSFLKIFFERKGATADFSDSNETPKRTRRRVKKIERSRTPKDQRTIEHYFQGEKREKDVESPISAKRKWNFTEKENKKIKNTKKKINWEGSTHYL